MFAVLAGNVGEAGTAGQLVLGFTPSSRKLHIREQSQPLLSQPFESGGLRAHSGGEKLELHCVLEHGADSSNSANKFLQFALGYSGPASPFEALRNRGLVHSWTAELRDQGDYTDLVLEMGLTEWESNSGKTALQLYTTSQECSRTTPPSCKRPGQPSRLQLPICSTTPPSLVWEQCSAFFVVCCSTAVHTHSSLIRCSTPLTRNWYLVLSAAWFPSALW